MTDAGEWERFALKGKRGKRIYLGLRMPDDERQHVRQWCEDNCRGRWWISDSVVYGSFELEDDAMLFKMVWGQ